MTTQRDQTDQATWRNWVWLPICASLIALAGLGINGRLASRLEPDSRDYIEYSFESLRSALSGIRTPGYPLFVSIINQTMGLDAIPIVHWAAFSAAVLLFFFGMIRIGFRPCTSAWVAGAMMFSRVLPDLGAAILSDCLAIALVIAAIAAMLFCLSSTAKWWHWMLLAFLVAANYFVRPAMLFMMILVPLLIGWLDTWILHRDRRWREMFNRSMISVCLTVIPFFTYCGLRYFVVGEFGFVSFAGYNVVGIAGQAIDAEMIEQLPPESRPLATLIFERRNRWDDYVEPKDYESMEWMYNQIVWQIAVPAAKELHGDDPAIINLKLKNLARQVFAIKPRFYWQWLVWNGEHAFREIIELVIRDTGTLIALALALFAIGFNLVLPKPKRKNELSAESVNEQSNWELQILFWIAMSYSVSCTLLILLVEPSLGRYVTSAMIFWPAVVALLSCQLIERLLYE